MLRGCACRRRLAGRNAGPAGRGARRRAAAGDAPRLPRPAPPRPPAHHAEAGRPGRHATRTTSSTRSRAPAFPLEGEAADGVSPLWRRAAFRRCRRRQGGLDPDWLRTQQLMIDFRKGRRAAQAGAQPAHARPQVSLPGAATSRPGSARLPIVSAAQAVAVRRRHRHGLPSAGRNRFPADSSRLRWEAVANTPFLPKNVLDMLYGIDFMSFLTCYLQCSM
jgi:hypothetical protein